MSTRQQASMSVQAPMPALADITLQGLKQRGAWNQAKQDLFALDLVRIERPEVQRVLRALGVAPKPREWSFDKGLKKTIANHLKAHAILHDAIQTFFLENIMTFWRLLGLRSAAQTRALLRSETRAFEAMMARSRENADFLKHLNRKELDDYIAYQKAVMQDLVHQYEDLQGLMHMITLEFTRDFVQLVDKDKKLQTIFENVPEDKLELFAEKYLEKRLKLEVKNETLAQECDEALGQCFAPETPRPEPQLKPQERREQLQEKLRAAVEQLKHSKEQEQAKRFEQLNLRFVRQQQKLERLPLRVAQQCDFNSTVCANMTQHQLYVNQTMADLCAPRLSPMLALHKQMQANKACQAQLSAHMEPIERRINRTSLNASELTSDSRPKPFKSPFDLKFTR